MPRSLVNNHFLWNSCDYITIQKLMSTTVMAIYSVILKISVWSTVNRLPWYNRYYIIVNVIKTHHPHNCKFVLMYVYIHVSEHSYSAFEEPHIYSLLLSFLQLNWVKCLYLFIQCCTFCYFVFNNAEVS